MALVACDYTGVSYVAELGWDRAACGIFDNGNLSGGFAGMGNICDDDGLGGVAWRRHPRG